MAGIQDFLTADFSENYAEAHRRRPTHFSGPMLTSVVALYHPKHFRKTFKPYLEGLLTFIGEDVALAGPIYDQLHYPEPDTKNPSSASSSATATPSTPDFIFERPVNGDFDRAMWRLEIHRDYAALTLFVGFDVMLDCGNRYLALALKKTSGSSYGAVIDRQSCATPHAEVFRALYEALARPVVAKLETLFPHLDGVYAAFPVKGAPDKRRVFFRAYGVVAPWTVVGFGIERRFWPRFPARETTGFASRRLMSRAANRTDQFLKSIWQDGVARHLLNVNAVEPPSTDRRPKSGPDSVACFVQRGHGLYVSSLGYRDSADDTSPLKYMLLYSDENPDERNQTRNIPPDAPATPKPTYPKSPQAEAEPTQYTWRLSRLVGRLHDLGIARLAALRNQHSLLTFAQQLRSVEAELNRLAPMDHAGVSAVQHRLQTYATQVNEPIVARSARSRYYMDVIKSLSGDLDVITLPSYQPYHHFVRRRLYSQIDYLSSIGPRYERLIERFRAIYDYETSKEILRIQRLADVVGSVILIFYMMEIVEHAAPAVRGVWRYACVDRPGWDVVCRRAWLVAEQGGHESTASKVAALHLFPITDSVMLLVGFLIYLAMGQRVFDVARTWRKPGRAPDDPKRALQLVLVVIILLPYFPFWGLAWLGRKGLEGLVWLAKKAGDWWRRRFPPRGS